MLNRTALVIGIILVAVITGLFVAGVKGKTVEKSVVEDILKKASDEFTTEEKKHFKKIPEALQIMEIPQNSVATQGEMLFLENDKKSALPLIHTDVLGTIEGFIARVNVSQIFVNTMESTIEAIYTFPLPENAAVDSMVLVIGDKRIRGVIKEREEARVMYEDARKQGKTASLLEQQRPNIFIQSAANILPGDTITITISYLQILKYKNGNYLFNFPMVVGPRYIPGQPIRSENNGTEDPTDQVPDAHNITPPILPENTRSGHNLSLQVEIRKGIEVKKLACPSHKIEVISKDDSKVVKISQNDRIPNKDFLLEYTVADSEINTVLLTHKTKDEGFFQLIMIPKLDISEKEIFPRELVFVIDNSGSMSGYPLEKCKELMKFSLLRMRRDDMFRVVKFAGSAEVLSPYSLSADAENVQRALDFVDDMRGGGGTEMMNAVNAVFDAPQDGGRKKLVLFMTDGYIGNEREIISTIRKKLDESRVFSLGVGSSVNRYLLEGMGYAGRGDCMIIRQDGDAQKAIEEFYSKIDAPVLTNLSINWDGVEIYDPQPGQLPDLFHSQPLTLIGKYKNGGKGILRIKGELSTGKRYQNFLEITLPDINEENSVLPPLWARKKIEETDLFGNLSFDGNTVNPDSTKNIIRTLGLEYKIMTQYTSFIAIDDAVRNKSGRWTSVEQPVVLPEGVSEQSQPSNRLSSGNVRSKVTSKGVCGAMSGPMAGSLTTSANAIGNGGYATGIDAILSGAGGLRAGGSNGIGRKGVAGIGYGAGYGSGYGGGGSGSIDGSLNMKKLGSLKLSEPEFLKGGALLSGGRSKASIMRVVMQNMAALRYVYSKRLGNKPGLQGEIKVKFSIDENGTVISCKIVSSTVNDSILESEIVEKIKRWVFEKIDKTGDITELVYPFMFNN